MLMTSDHSIRCHRDLGARFGNRLSEDARIEALENFPDNFVAFQCNGQVTKVDYETVFVPRVEAALRTHDEIRIYYRIGSEFTRFDPGAVWEDFEVGVGHLWQWEKAAVVTDVDWIETTMKVFGILIPCEIRIFPISEASVAQDWIVAPWTATCHSMIRVLDTTCMRAAPTWDRHARHVGHHVFSAERIMSRIPVT
jgi:hypothetical protein